MAVQYRPAAPEEMGEYAYSGQIGFGIPSGDDDVARRLVERPLRPEWTLCAFDEGVMAAKMATLPLVISWNGRAIDCGGVTAVTALPTHRRRGHVGELMRRSFATMHESGQPVAMLWATMAAIYQRFGYGNAFTNCLWDFDARDLRFVDEIATSGGVRLVPVSQAHAVLADVYARFAAQRTLMLHRSEDWWSRVLRLLGTPLSPPLLVAVYEEGGQALGYVTYDVEDHRRWARARDQRLDVLDFVWLSPAAHRALIRYLASYDLSPTIRCPRVPLDDPLFYQVDEPRKLGVTLTDGSLLRIVDLQAALEGRGYDRDGRISLAIEDTFCPWNTGTWDLEAESGGVRIRQTGGEADLTVGPRALAMLVSGYQSATSLARAGLIGCAETRVLRKADSLFRTACAPFCMDHF